jgi:hypothetical protein
MTFAFHDFRALQADPLWFPGTAFLVVPVLLPPPDQCAQCEKELEGDERIPGDRVHRGLAGDEIVCCLTGNESGEEYDIE